MDKLVVPDSSTLLKLPYDRLRAGSTARRSKLSRSLDDACIGPALAALPATAREAACLAAVVAVLYRYTGQSPIALAASPAPGRSQRGLSIGPDGQQDFAALRDDVEAALASRPGEMPGDCGVAVRFLDADALSTAEPGMADLELLFCGQGDDWRLAAFYDAAVFDASTVERLLRHVLNLLRTGLEQPGLTLAALPLFEAGELDWLAAVTTGPARAPARDLAHREFERHAREQPQRTAVRFGAGCLSYAELDEAANRLAHLILARGVGANERVVVCIDPSPDIAVCLLAIFKAGASYVPLNPAFPQHRIDTVLQDTAPKLVLTHAAHRGLFDSAGEATLCLDEPGAGLGGQPATAPAVEPSADDNAYVFYTSGTTGKPKGSLATYGNLAHFLAVSREIYGIDAQEVIPSVASYTFSISMFELMAPLSAGGTLVILERAVVLDAERLSRALADVSFAHIGPSLLKKVVKYLACDQDASTAFDGLRHISSGGDMVPPELLRDLCRLFPGAEVWVIYGCSEISLMGCTWRVDDKPEVLRTYVGRPFPNVGLALLDDDGNQVPVGAVGNVAFSGGGVVDGYLNRPELTGTLFFERDGRRFYNTGDRGRLSPGGDLELLGRRDFQVQIRGMRVELGEIEYHLRQAGGVRDGVVADTRRDDNEALLVAYFVAETPGAVDPEALRAHMRARLPDYMVPSFYIELDALPLNLNLKIDRRALPELDPAAGIVEAPQTPTERTLAAIWAELLRVPTIGRGDNFLLRGGDSLLAMDMILAVQRKLGVKLDGMDILRESLQVLAAICDRHSPSAETAAGTVRAPAAPARRLYRSSRSFYFGEGNSLYGVYHAPPAETARPAVLVCPPIGQEQVRCHFLLRALADALAGYGHPVLRFDWFATGDSLGGDRAATPARWLDDVRQARTRLQALAGERPLAVLGARLGSLFAWHALADAGVSHWVFWDPVVDARAHLEAQRRMHANKVAKMLVVRNLRRPTRAADVEELLGFTYSQAALAGLEALGDPTAGQVDDKPVTCVLTRERNLAWQGAELRRLDDDCRWYDSTRITTAITFRSVSDALLAALRGEAPR